MRLGSGPYLSAGGNHYKTFWTRDFCFSVRGLLALKHYDVVRNHLEKLISIRRKKDGLVPKCLDSIFPPLRVVQGCIRNIIPFWPKISIRDPLKPEYHDEHASVAIDSNLLVLLASYQYFKASGDRTWWDAHLPGLTQIYSFYDSTLRGGLITQGRFSDWQDSVRRKGRTFYTNVLYACVSQRLAEFPEFNIEANKLERIRKKIRSVFFDSDTCLFRAVDGEPQICLDGNLFAIDLEFFARGSQESKDLYLALKNHPLWKSHSGIPGFVTYPDYPNPAVAFQAKLVGLRHYHDSIHWSWLMAFSAKVCYQMGDQESGNKIFKFLEKLASRDFEIHEVYDSRQNFLGWESLLYRSEKPFSWGAGFLIDAISASGLSTA